MAIKHGPRFDELLDFTLLSRIIHSRSCCYGDKAPISLKGPTMNAMSKMFSSTLGEGFVLPCTVVLQVAATRMS